MSALLDGFRTGYQVENQRQQQQENNRRYEEGMRLRRQQMDMSREQHDASMVGRGLQNTILQEQVNDIPAERDYKAKTRALGLDTAGIQNKTAKTNLDIANDSLQASKDDRAKKNAYEKLKVYAANKDVLGFINDKESFKGTNLAMMQSSEGIEAAASFGDRVKGGDFSGAVNDANILFKPMLNRNVGNIKGRNGSIIRDIAISGIEQQDDGSLKLPVIVTTDDGPYRSYISEERGIDPDDPDKVYRPEELLGTAAAMGQFAHLLKSSGLEQQIQSGMNGVLGQNANQVATKPDWKEIAIYDEAGNKKGLAGFYDPNTGQHRAIPSQLKDEITNAEINPEDLTARNEKVNSQAIQYVLSVLVQQGIDQGDAQAIANKVIETANQYKAARQKVDMNKLTSTITQQYLQAKEARQQNAAKRAEESQQRLLALPSKGLF